MTTIWEDFPPDVVLLAWTDLDELSSHYVRPNKMLGEDTGPLDEDSDFWRWDITKIYHRRDKTYYQLDDFITIVDEGHQVWLRGDPYR